MALETTVFLLSVEAYWFDSFRFKISYQLKITKSIDRLVGRIPKAEISRMFHAESFIEP